MSDPGIDWIEDPFSDDDENDPVWFNEDFESDCYDGDEED